MAAARARGAVTEEVTAAAVAIKDYWDHEDMRWLIAATNSKCVMQVAPNAKLTFEDLVTHAAIVLAVLNAWPTHVPS
eukprot:11047884-Alexandrium_andersonii.AAC.1